MGHTVSNIIFIFNASPSTAEFINRETGESWTLDPQIGQHTYWGVPWACRPEEIGLHRLEVVAAPNLTYYIWQCWESDGDFVRFSSDRAFHYLGDHVYPTAWVGGPGRAMLLRNDRSLYIGTVGVTVHY
jgi:hypothetical protein